MVSIYKREGEMKFRATITRVSKLLIARQLGLYPVGEGIDDSHDSDGRSR